MFSFSTLGCKVVEVRLRRGSPEVPRLGTYVHMHVQYIHRDTARNGYR